MEIRYRLTSPFPLDAALRVEGLTVLFGPSGAGKTTLLKAVAGLLRGEGTPYAGLPPERRPVGYMPQHYALFPHLTALENVAFPLAHLRRSARRARAGELLRNVGMEALASRYPRQLSGGEQQRVALARALAREPELLLLDEPTSALDLPTRSEVTERLFELVEEFGIPTLVVTHDAAFARSSHRVAVMVGGRVLQEGFAEDVFHRPGTAEIARLVGFRNLFSGRVQEVEPPWVWIETPLGRIGALGVLDVEPGALVWWAIRPEDVLVRPLGSAEAEPGTRNELVGAVQGVGQDSVRVITDGTAPVELRAFGKNGSPEHRGERVRVLLPPDAIRVMRQ